MKRMTAMNLLRTAELVTLLSVALYYNGGGKQIGVAEARSR